MQNEIKAYSPSGLEAIVEELELPRFRVEQLIQWLYERGVSSYDEMTNLPASLRKSLSEQYPLFAPTLIDHRCSKDGTRKYVLSYHDGTMVETVAIPSSDIDDGNPKRLTVCFSTQAGCAMACAFCATGKEGFSRNLLPGEILDQVLIAQKDMGWRVSNLVAMGQGEPFLNYDNTLAALRFANHPKGLAIGARHITVSTCGILKGIERFSHEQEQFTLAVSLHSAQQEVRDALMPKLANMKLPQLREAITDYTTRTKRRVTFEYCMIKGVNDTPEALRALKSFCRNLLCHINLLTVNETGDVKFRPSSTGTVREWVASLTDAHIQTTVRLSKGADIFGACGQLKNSL